MYDWNRDGKYLSLGIIETIKVSSPSSSAKEVLEHIRTTKTRKYTQWKTCVYKKRGKFTSYAEPIFDFSEVIPRFIEVCVIYM